MPHVPLFVSDKFKGKTGQGLYGDVIAEIDWSVGQILDAIKRAKLDDNTLVIFTSDNGPWLTYGNHGGSRGPLPRGQGHGVRRRRRACRSSCAGRAASRRRRSVAMPAMTIDLLPTLAGLAGAAVPRTASSTAATSGRC